MRRLAFLAAGVLAGIGLAALGVFAAQNLLKASAPANWHGLELDAPRPAYNFAFIEPGGKTVQLSDFRGKVVAVFFGYTFCPDVCPATLATLRNAVETLGEQSADVQVIFVSVDPERDTPQRAMDYARAFNLSFIGLTGSLDEVAAAASPFGVYFEKDFSASAAGYLVNHTAVVTAVDRDGKVRLLWPLGVKAEDIAADLRQLLR